MDIVRLAEKFVDTGDEIGIYEFIKKYGIHCKDDILLANAIENGDLKMTKFLIDLGADINAQNCFFDYAIKSGNLELAKLLYDQGIFYDADDALSTAVIYEHPFEMIKWLVEDLEADPTYENGDLFSYAAEFGWINVMQLFIETAGPDAFDYDEALHCTLLGIVKHPDMDSNDLKNYPSKIKAATNAVRYLIAIGADPNHNQNGALKIAVKNNQPEIAQLLLDAGAKEKDIPLLIASNLGHIEIVKLLLKVGADPMYGNGIAIEKALQNGHEKIVKLLLANVERKKAFDAKVNQPVSPNNPIEENTVPIEENTVMKAFETISLEENNAKEA